jgi:glycine/D-amino acid oxidase-like deaminating enzyme
LSQVAVIGGGIFGTVGALALASAGHRVTLFEREQQLLTKATQNSQNRLHLGLHYPRDLDTARQSVLGFQSFKDRYGEAVDLTFPNYYALAAKNSKTNRDDFIRFAEIANISIKEIDPKTLQYIGANPLDYAGIWLCNEGVIDIPLLRLQLINELRKSNVEVLTKTEILSAQLYDRWRLLDERSNSYTFDTVFRCTYGSDRIKVNDDPHPMRNYEYHKTAILNVQLNQPRFGFTIVDGDFLTVLPDGKSNRSLIYAPSISTLIRFEGEEYPAEWDTFSISDLNIFRDKLLKRLNDWLPSVEVQQINRIMLAIRSIQPNVSKTDSRTSSVIKKSNNFYDIWSGKIDHCVDLSNKMVELV